MHHGGLERHQRVQRWQQAGDSLRQHGLARARRADQQQVMATGRSQFEREPCAQLPADVGQIGRCGFVEPGRGRGWVGPAATGQCVHDLAQRRGTPHFGRGNDRGLVPRRSGHHCLMFGLAGHHWGDTGEWSDRAVETQLADERHAHVLS